MATTTMIVRHRVKDSSAWRSVYDSGDKQDVFVLHRFPTVEQAEAFAGSERLREAMTRAGVAGPPRIELAVDA